MLGEHDFSGLAKTEKVIFNVSNSGCTGACGGLLIFVTNLSGHFISD